MHKHFRRLERNWIEAPIYFITTCTQNRCAILARDEAAAILTDEWRSAHARHGWIIGRYVIMPDHVHFFCAPEHDAKNLSDFVGFWKSYRSRRVNALGRPRSAPAATTGRQQGSVGPAQSCPRSAPAATTGRHRAAPAPTLWQREFFDHLLRSSESYDQKWNYVRDNPVRAGLVSDAEHWKHAGEIADLML